MSRYPTPRSRQRRLAVGTLARCRVRSSLLRLLGYDLITVKVVRWLSMGDHPDYDYEVKPIGRLGRWWSPWRSMDVADADIYPLDIITRLGDLVR